jgi:hypothetical protein
VIATLAALELLALTAARNAWRVLQAPGPASLDEAVVVVVLGACVLLGGWAVLSTTVACAAHLQGRLGATAARWSRTLAPAVTRRVAALLVGAALGGTLPAVASATAATASTASPAATAAQMATSSDSSATASSSPVVRVPGWTPSRPVQPSPPVARLVTSGSAPPSTGVVVHRGDSLWTIAHRHLGPGATDAEVARAWPHWYAANRDVVGPDPDVLLPGQVLRVPDRSEAGARAVGSRP